ncbi:MAG TPA: hypothetical protein PL126_05245, partial [Candidatus Cloacimonadota bacterium]|nr:hypothetical protein [Candidatus Cloacimonadota bacterium]
MEKPGFDGPGFSLGFVGSLDRKPILDLTKDTASIRCTHERFFNAAYQLCDTSGVVILKKLSLILVLILALAASFAQTPIPFEATYTFGANGNVQSFVYNGTPYSGISMGSIEKKFLTSVSSAGNFRAKGWPDGMSSPRIVFTISAVPGYKYTVNSITFGLGRAATGATHALWRGSASYKDNINNYTSLHGRINNDN